MSTVAVKVSIAGVAIVDIVWDGKQRRRD